MQEKEVNLFKILKHNKQLFIDTYLNRGPFTHTLTCLQKLAPQPQTLIYKPYTQC